MHIEYITHASLMCRTEKTRLLTDPFFFMERLFASVMTHFPPRELDPEHLGTIDFLFSSHDHDDHCDVNTLRIIRDRVKTALIPEERAKLLGRYRFLGYADVRCLKNGVTERLNDELALTCFWSDPVDSLLVVEMAGKTLIHLNDCHPTEELVRRVRERFSIDYLFLLYTGAQELLYPLMLDEPPAEIERRCREKEDVVFAERLRIIDGIAPRVVVPYSMTMAYIQPDQQWINEAYRLTPPLFAERLAQVRPEQRCWSLEPGDVIDTSDDTIARYRPESLWGKDLAEYARNLAAYSRSAVADGSIDLFTAGEPELCDAPWRAFLEKRMQRPLTAMLEDRRLLFHVAGATRTRAYLADFGKRTVEAYEPAQAPADADFEITLPPFLAMVTTTGMVDGFSLVHSHRIRFKRNAPLPRPMTEVEEVGFLANLYCALCE
jgi:hypothetical protein